MMRQEAAGIYAWLPMGLRRPEEDRADRSESKTAPAPSNS